MCHLKRAKNSRLYPNINGAYFGYCASKDEKFYGLKIHVATAASGRPAEVLPLCGCSADLTGLKEMVLDLPPACSLWTDKAYTDYGYEEELRAERQIVLLPLRKKNHKRQHPEALAKAIAKGRKRIETTFSQVTARLGRRIYAVTAACFESKIMATFVAYAILGVAS